MHPFSDLMAVSVSIDKSRAASLCANRRRVSVITDKRDTTPTGEGGKCVLPALLSFNVN